MRKEGDSKIIMFMQAKNEMEKQNEIPPVQATAEIRRIIGDADESSLPYGTAQQTN